MQSLVNFFSVRAIFMLCLGSLFFGCSGNASVTDKRIQIDNPDKSLSFILHIKSGELAYEVLAQDQIILGKSRLGINRSDGNFAKKLSLSEFSKDDRLTAHIEFLSGKQSQVSHQYSQGNFTFKNEKDQLVKFQVKVFEQGVAFRYLFPESSDNKVTILEEQSEFYFPQGGEAWLQPYQDATQWSPAYEAVYKPYALGSSSPMKNGWCFPALFNTANHYVLLSEAGPFDGNYAAMHLKKDAPNGRYALAWPDKDEANGYYDQKPSSKLPWQTPWRVINIHENLASLVTCDLVKSLAPASKIKNTDWIKPGPASWSWLTDNDSPQDYQKLVPYIDLAAEMGWPYSLIDANWDNMANGNIEKLVEYAKSKNVNLLLWYNSGGKHNIITEAPRDLMDNRQARRKEFERIHKMGIKGVKIDFFQSDKQEIMQLYPEILEDAADFEILVNFHGCTIPRGWERTYPNLLTMEAVRGEEVYGFGKNFPDNAPVANCILPFTRNIVGPMDYTPTVFSNGKMKHKTTMAHELALSIVFESGWQHLADGPKQFGALPEKTKTILNHLPTAWDEIKLLQGAVGKDLVIARRKGSDWYIAGINGEGVNKEWHIDFEAITDQGKLTLVVDKGRKLKDSSGEIKNATLNIMPYGGFVAKITAANTKTTK